MLLRGGGETGGACCGGDAEAADVVGVDMEVLRFNRCTLVWSSGYP
jgi:hypothetical protein